MNNEEIKIALKVLNELNEKQQQRYADLIDKDGNGNPKVWDMWEEDAINYDNKIEDIKQDLSELLI